jgi:hypothetical protein
MPLKKKGSDQPTTLKELSIDYLMLLNQYTYHISSNNPPKLHLTTRLMKKEKKNRQKEKSDIAPLPLFPSFSSPPIRTFCLMQGVCLSKCESNKVTKTYA